MPIRALNSAPIFVAMMMKLDMEWDTLAKERGLKNILSKIIVDDVLLYGRPAEHILACFSTFLDVVKHHYDTLKLKR